MWQKFNDALEEHIASIFSAEGGITSIQKKVVSIVTAMGTSDLIIEIFFCILCGYWVNHDPFCPPPLLILLFCVPACACVRE